MKIGNIILGLVIICLLIVGYGIYQVYEIFYPNYFSSTDYTDVTFEKGQLPTKVEVLLSGFKNVGIVATASIISLAVIVFIKLIRRRNDSFNS